ncbi:MAG TPA: tRNA 2-thiocytidine biosynthesis TtcA family protein [Bacillota bacterium]|nr:tRNA 2-thiocytidine biosynthesis TtcA family protein [Bacillota bacterium]
MRRSFPKDYIRKLWRAIVEFDMLQPGDRVLIGLSGGKDSSFLAYSLACARDSRPFDFELGVATLDLGLSPEPVDFAGLRQFAGDLDMPFYGDRIDAGEFILSGNDKSPCAKCAHLRRGALVSLAKAHGYNKLAYAHHLDDAVETFLMSTLYSGQITTFQPTTLLDRNGITVIRPLCYFREQEIVYGQRHIPFTPQKSPCPLDKHTIRQKVKDLIRTLDRENGCVFDNLTAAMRAGSPLEQWPRRLTRAELKPRYIKLMNTDNKKNESDSGGAI